MVWRATNQVFIPVVVIIIIIIILYMLFLSQDELGSVYKTPCVVFTGHPSLRCGDAVHFMEVWGSSGKNAVVFTGKYW